MSTPLVFVGSYFGFKRETISAPVRTNQIGNVDAIYVDAIHSKGLFELPFELPLTFIPPFYLPLTAHTPSHNTPSHMLLLTSYQYTLSSLTARWVSVKDARPSRPGQYIVLVSFDGGTAIDVDSWEEGTDVRPPEWSEFGEQPNETECNITHWLSNVPPLPEGK